MKKNWGGGKDLGCRMQTRGDKSRTRVQMILNDVKSGRAQAPGSVLIINQQWRR